MQFCAVGLFITVAVQASGACKVFWELDGLETCTPLPAKDQTKWDKVGVLEQRIPHPFFSFGELTWFTCRPKTTFSKFITYFRRAWLKSNKEEDGYESVNIKDTCFPWSSPTNTFCLLWIGKKKKGRVILKEWTMGNAFSKILFTLGTPSIFFLKFTLINVFKYTIQGSLISSD